MRRTVISILSILLLFALIPTALAFNVNAADDYSDIYRDVKRGDWFYSNVLILSDMGVVNGYPDKTFRPSDNVTCAEFTKMLVTVMGYPLTTPDGTVYFDDPGAGLPVYFSHINLHWSYPYIRAAFANGIITVAELGGDFTCDTSITRELMIRMMVRALELPLYPGDSSFADKADKYALTAFREYLLRGYVENGSRYFKGKGLTTRAEASTIVLRTYEYSIDPDAYKEKEILSNASKYSIDEKTELIDLFTTVNRSFSETVVLETAMDFTDWTDIYTLASGMYPEYFLSRGFYCNYLVNSGRYVVNIKYSSLIPVIKEQSEKAKESAEKAAAEIRGYFEAYVPPEEAEEDKNTVIEAEKKLSEAEITDVYSEANEKNLLRAAHDYLTQHCSYDYTQRDTGYIIMQSYTAYGALVENKAVCQGYSAAMNLLCDALGIRSYSITGLAPGSLEAHIWNAVLLDGEIYFTDATYDDPEAGERSDYRLMTAEEMKNFGYTWDRNTVRLDYFYIAN